MIRHTKQIALLGTLMSLLLGALTPQATSAAAPTAESAASQFGASQLGQTVTVQGTIVRESHYSVGYRLWMSNSQGMTILNIHDEDYLSIANLGGLGNGATVSVQGKVWKPYRDIYQVVPKSSKNVKVITPAAAFGSRATFYNMGGLSGNDHAAMMVVQGQVVGVRPCVVYGIDPRIDIDPADPAVCVTIRDNTGGQDLAIPIVASQQVNRTIYKIGATLRAYGQLRGKPKKGTQIYVALPVDVAVVK
jgi:hypothetical protein